MLFGPRPLSILPVLVFATAGLGAASFPAAAGTIRVPDDYLNIQNALNHALPGDTVLVSPGSYAGGVSLPEGVTLLSEYGPENTTLRGVGVGGGVNIVGGSDSTRVIGFTVRDFADGVLASGGAPVVRGNVVLDNHITGVDVTLGSQPLVEGNVITGGPIGILCDAGAQPQLLHNTVVGNERGMRFLSGTVNVVEENIVVWNTVDGLRSEGGICTITCNDVWSNGVDYAGDLTDQTGVNGNISADPVFCDPLAGGYGLRDGSPCGGGGGCGRMGARDVQCAGRVVRVDGAGGGEVTTIQAGIDLAVVPDTVRIAAGTYLESVVLDRALVVEGTAPGSTVVDAGGASVGWEIAAADSNVLVRNLTVRGAIGEGIAFTGAGAGRLSRVVSVGNGTGVRVSGGAPSLEDLTIGASTGDGVLADGGAAVSLTRVLVSANAGAGVRVTAGAGAVLACCDVEGNAGGDFDGLPDPTGTDGNRSVDPLFCDADAGRLSLRDGSPCLPDTGGCGSCGALGLGCLGRVWEVFKDGSGDAPGIQAAMDSSLAGDSVRVGPGTYAEAVDLAAGIRLEAMEGAGATQIVKPSSQWGVTIAGGDSSTVVTGFGIAWFEGGGVRVLGGSGVRIEGCRVYANTLGVAVNAGWAAIDSTLFWSNGQGVRSAGDSVIISRSTFADQHGRGMKVNAGSVLRLERSIVSGSGAAGIEVESGGFAELACNDVWLNGGGDYVGTSAGSGDFSADPLFCNPTEGDFHIAFDSPCAPAQSGGCGLVGMEPVLCGVETAVGTGPSPGEGKTGGLALAVRPHPLPGRGLVELRAPAGATSAEFRLLDVLGRERWRGRYAVASGETTQLRWDLGGEEDLASGIYFLQVECGGARAAVRVVLLR